MSSDISQENFNNYKEIHYENQEKEAYHEYGAHFSFKEICSKLKKLLSQQNLEGIHLLTEKKKTFYFVILKNNKFYMNSYLYLIDIHLKRNISFKIKDKIEQLQSNKLQRIY